MAEAPAPITVLIDGEPHELTLVGLSLEAIGAPGTTVQEVDPAVCPVHHPVQHRDLLPKWCDVCGRTEDGLAPSENAAPPPPPLPPVGTRVRHVRSGMTGYVVRRGEIPGTVMVDWDAAASTELDQVNVRNIVVLPAVD